MFSKARLAVAADPIEFLFKVIVDLLHGPVRRVLSNALDVLGLRLTMTHRRLRDVIGGFADLAHCSGPVPANRRGPRSKTISAASRKGRIGFSMWPFGGAPTAPPQFADDQVIRLGASTQQPARFGPGGALFVEWRSSLVLHFACKLLRFHCDALRCFVLKI